jgi:hypothetical protein
MGWQIFFALFLLGCQDSEKTNKSSSKTKESISDDFKEYINNFYIANGWSRTGLRDWSHFDSVFTLADSNEKLVNTDGVPLMTLMQESMGTLRTVLDAWIKKRDIRAPTPPYSQALMNFLLACRFLDYGTNESKYPHIQPQDRERLEKTGYKLLEKAKKGETNQKYNPYLDMFADSCVARSDGTKSKRDCYDEEALRILEAMLVVTVLMKKTSEAILPHMTEIFASRVHKKSADKFRLAYDRMMKIVDLLLDPPETTLDDRSEKIFRESSEIIGSYVEPPERKSHHNSAQGLEI